MRYNSKDKMSCKEVRNHLVPSILGYYKDDEDQQREGVKLPGKPYLEDFNAQLSIDFEKTSLEYNVLSPEKVYNGSVEIYLCLNEFGQGSPINAAYVTDTKEHCSRARKLGQLLSPYYVVKNNITANPLYQCIFSYNNGKEFYSNALDDSLCLNNNRGDHLNVRVEILGYFKPRSSVSGSWSAKKVWTLEPSSKPSK